MAKLRRVRVVYAKIEGTYGTDPVPVGTDAVATKNFQLSDPYAGDRVARDLDRDDLGLQEEINVNPHVTLSFDVELAGSGAAGTAPAMSALLRACGWAETINVGIDVSYKPVSTFTDSVTLYAVVDGLLHKLVGGRGKAAMTFQKGIPYLSFNFMLLYTKPIDDAAPLTPDFTAYQTPVPFTNANTTFTIGAFTGGKLVSLSCDTGINLFPRNVPGQEEILQTDRQVTGTIVMDTPTIAEKDLFADLVESHSGINTDLVKIVHGTTAGNIVQFDAPKVQLSTIGEGDDNGLLNYSMSARYIPDVTDDEVVLTFK